MFPLFQQKVREVARNFPRVTEQVVEIVRSDMAPEKIRLHILLVSSFLCL